MFYYNRDLYLRPLVVMKLESILLLDSFPKPTAVTVSSAGVLLSSKWMRKDAALCGLSGPEP